MDYCPLKRVIAPLKRPQAPPKRANAPLNRPNMALRRCRQNIHPQTVAPGHPAGPQTPQKRPQPTSKAVTLPSKASERGSAALPLADPSKSTAPSPPQGPRPPQNRPLPTSKVATLASKASERPTKASEFPLKWVLPTPRRKNLELPRNPALQVTSIVDTAPPLKRPRPSKLSAMASKAGPSRLKAHISLSIDADDLQIVI